MFSYYDKETMILSRKTTSLPKVILLDTQSNLLKFKSKSPSEKGQYHAININIYKTCM